MVPKLLILAGLPGTGKTTLARRLAKAFRLLYLRVDCIEVPFRIHNSNAGSVGEGYEALKNLALENLRLGQGVIIDTVNSMHISRQLFTNIAKRLTIELFQFELKMKNPLLHQQRVEERKPDIDGLKVPTWADVLNRTYEPWNDTIDGQRSEIWTDNMEAAYQTCLDIINENQSKNLSALPVPD